MIELVDIAALVRLYRVYTARRSAASTAIAARPDFIAAIAAMLGVLVFDTLPGLFIGIARLAAAAALPRVPAARGAVLGRVPGDRDAVRRRRPRSPDNEPVPGIVVLRVEGGLFFANADTVRAAHPSRRRRGHLGGRARRRDVPFDRRDRRRPCSPSSPSDLERDGVRLVVARDIGQVRDVLRRAGDSVGPDRVYPTVAAAVEALEARPPGRVRA